MSAEDYAGYLAQKKAFDDQYNKTKAAAAPQQYPAALPAANRPVAAAPGAPPAAAAPAPHVDDDTDDMYA